MEKNVNIKKNDIIELDIADLNNLGCGVGKTADGMVVFVKGAVTGDRVVAKIIKTSSSFLVGKLEKIIVSSPHRFDGDGLRKNECKAPQSCGGCIYRNIKYEHELVLKRDYVENAFRKAGLPNVTVLDTAHTDRVERYRNKAQYPVREVGGRARAGFFATKTHDLIPCEECLLQPDVFGEIVSYVVDFAEKNKIRAYDEESGKGVLRHIYLRIGEKTGEIMVCLVINADKMAMAADFADGLMAKFPSVASVMLNINKKNTNVILGDRFICIGGRDHIIDELCGLKFKISAGSFYQVNRDGAEMLYGLARERAALTGKETVADLYCGTGTIGLSMAKNAARIVGIEIVDEAVECAKENAGLNGIGNAHFFCGDASDTRGLLARAKDTLGDFCPDVVVIDPPRKGTTEELVNYLDSLGVKRIVYVSCNPDTLARDCAWFAQKGYEIGEVTPVDMFPGTGHVESVVCLTKKNSNDKKQAFLENTKLLSDKLGITPLMYGSLGLEYLTGEDLNADDIDILIPKILLEERWSEFKTILLNDGYTLIDEHEHEFEKEGIHYSYAQIEELESFAGIGISEIATISTGDFCFKLLSLSQYLKVYTASSKDGYRVNVRKKKDSDKIEFIHLQLQKDAKDKSDDCQK